MEAVLILIAFSVMLILIIGVGILKTKKYSNIPPGSFGWSILGESLEFLTAGQEGAPVRFMKERTEKYGSELVFKTSMLGEKTAIFCSPAENKFLFSNESKLVTVWWPNSVKKVFQNCLINTAGEEAKWRRKILFSFFTPDCL